MKKQIKEKILIVNWRDDKWVSGGSKYSIELTKILNDKYDVHKLYCVNQNDRWDGKLIDSFLRIIKLIYFKYKVNRYVKQNKINYVINNSNTIALIKKNIPLLISVQHNDGKIIHNKWWMRIIKKILRILPAHFYSNIVVTFNEESSSYFKQKINKNAKYYNIALYNDGEFKNIYSKKANDIITIIRDHPQKNIKLLNLISGKLDRKIKVIGNISQKTMSTHNNLEYLGFKTIDELKKYILPSTKALILTSKYEGLPFVCIETLSLGIPNILLDSFTCAKFLINNGKNGILLNKNLNFNEIANIIKNTNFSKFNNSQIVEFSRKHFSYINFKQTWYEILNNKNYLSSSK